MGFLRESGTTRPHRTAHIISPAAPRCPTCGGGLQPWFEEAGRHVCVCQECRLRVVPEGVACTDEGCSIYEAESENLFLQDGNENYYLDETNQWACESKLAWINRWLPAQSSLLDAGANCGHFLQAAQAQYQAMGFDVSPWAVQWSKDRLGVNNRVASIYDLTADFDEHTFDAVTCWDVIEHLSDPAAALSQLRSMLKPGGLLFLSTPDAGSLVARAMGRNWHYLDTVQHVCLFNRHNLSQALGQAGFSMPEYTSFGRHYRIQYIADRLSQPAQRAALRCLGHIARVCLWPVLSRTLYIRLGDVLGAVARAQ